MVKSKTQQNMEQRMLEKKISQDSNLSILFTIAMSQSIVFSKLNLSKFLYQSLFFLFSKDPRHPFLLSYSNNPFLNDSDAKF